MERKLRQGILWGLLVGILIIVCQPFYPTTGLIPELVAFLTTIPLWIAAFLFQSRLTPVAEGSAVLIYFLAIGLLIGAAFERKRLWGWFFVVTLIINHYVVYDRFSRQMGEVLQTVLNYFG